MSDAKSIYKQGFLKFAEGEVDEAIALYREAIEAAPDLAIAWNGLSIALAQKGEFPEAISAAQKLVEIEPDEPLSQTNLSRILMQQGDIPAAEDAKGLAMQLQIKQKSGS
jgi:Flp pilus assembly protein TadD